MGDLLGMNCNVPTDIRFSFAGFRQRGGRTGPHQDGWGIALYEGKGARLFAYNGYLNDIKRKPFTFYQPIGTTDSEQAFCYLLDAIRCRFREPPPAYCTNKLCWIQRRALFSRAVLVDADLEVDFRQHTTPRDKVVVVATQPLRRDEAWTRCQPAELCVLGKGEPILRGGAHV